MAHPRPSLGAIAWIDQTSPRADEVKAFYETVVGWISSPVSMGDYSDYNMLPPSDPQPVAGICHARGINADLPSGWLVYVVIKDLDTALAACTRLGGKVLVPPRSMGGSSRIAVIEDPGGACTALYDPGE